MRYIQNYKAFEKKVQKIRRVTEKEIEKEEQKKDANVIDTPNRNEPVEGVKTDN